MVSTADAPAVRRLADLAAYAEGSIVSRMLLKQKSGSVTLFAFDRGEGLSEHTAPFEALVVVTDGQAEISVDGTAYTVGAGESIRLPAGVPHAVHAAEPFQMLLIMLRA